MNKEIKRQLILSMVLLSMFVMTLFFWYDNFVFHTYVTTSDYQYCFAGGNEDLSISGYEFSKDHGEEKYGGARIVALKDRFLLENDQVTIDFVIQYDQQEKRLTHHFDVKSDNEVLFMNVEKTNESLLTDKISTAQCEVVVERDHQKVYEQTITMQKQDIVVYNGANKKYALQNIYATSSWLKTGDFISTNQHISQQYPYVIIDYLYLKENGNSDNLNDYERFAYVKGKTQDILDGKNKSVAFFDDKGSLLDRELRCVVTLMESESQSQGYTFVLNLKGAIKAVE